jgi:quercetin dioxygenase-like cupin family protein
VAESGAEYLVFKDTAMRIVAPGSATGGQLCLAEFTSWPGGGPPPHTHDLREWFCVLDGTVDFSGPLGGQWSTAGFGKGATLYVPPGVPHTYRNNSDTPARFLCAMLPGSIEGYFRKVGTACTPEQFEQQRQAPMDMDFVRAALSEFGIGIHDPAGGWDGADVQLDPEDKPNASVPRVISLNDGESVHVDGQGVVYICDGRFTLEDRGLTELLAGAIWHSVNAGSAAQLVSQSDGGVAVLVEY